MRFRSFDLSPETSLSMKELSFINGGEHKIVYTLPDGSTVVITVPDSPEILVPCDNA